jgi:hypothetical protein
MCTYGKAVWSFDLSVDSSEPFFSVHRIKFVITGSEISLQLTGSTSDNVQRSTGSNLNQRHMVVGHFFRPPTRSLLTQLAR